MRRRWLPTILALTVATTPLRADEALFLDDFDSGDFCGWSTNPTPPAISEGEGTGQGLNDFLGDAIAISRCATVDGVTGSPVAGVGDYDFYSLAVDRPTLLRVTLAALGAESDFVPYVDVDDDEFFPPLGMSPPTAGASTTRQIWLPAAGNWYLFVSHADNWDRVFYDVVDPAPAGGADSTYRLTVDVDSFAGSFAVAGQFADLELGADGTLPAFRFFAGATDELQLAEVTAERLSPASPLDAKLYLVADPVTAPVTIAACDDQTTGGDCLTGSFEWVDPALTAVAMSDTAPHLLLVDFFDVYDPSTGDPVPLPASFDLELQFFSLSP
jgi:hypothetical protein